ncbi:MAG: RnfABCDGE type electron transport complex subunit G [Bacteroidales bacterium]|nr:RnfABCDGE type electron transport complex subunit G [Bacteroidales bacterium]
MNQKKQSLFKMILTLLVICSTTAFTLAFINDITKLPKEKTRIKKQEEALRAVLPEFDNNPIAERFALPVDGTADSIEVFPASKAGEPVGWALTTFSDNGFSGRVVLMIGFYPDGTIYDISVLSQKETPGLGTKMQEPRFLSQFKDKNPELYKLSVKKDGGDVDAITASTISSRAFCEAAQNAFLQFKTVKNNSK